MPRDDSTSSAINQSTIPSNSRPSTLHQASRAAGRLELLELIEHCSASCPNRTRVRRWFRHWTTCSSSINDCITSHRIYRASIITGRSSTGSINSSINGKFSAENCCHRGSLETSSACTRSCALLPLQHVIARLGIDSNQVRFGRFQRLVESSNGPQFVAFVELSAAARTVLDEAIDPAAMLGAEMRLYRALKATDRS